MPPAWPAEPALPEPPTDPATPPLPALFELAPAPPAWLEFAPALVELAPELAPEAPAAAGAPAPEFGVSGVVSELLHAVNAETTLLTARVPQNPARAALSLMACHFPS